MPRSPPRVTAFEFSCPTQLESHACRQKSCVGEPGKSLPCWQEFNLGGQFVAAEVVRYPLKYRDHGERTYHRHVAYRLPSRSLFSNTVTSNN